MGDKASLKNHFHSNVSLFWLRLLLVFVWLVLLFGLGLLSFFSTLLWTNSNFLMKISTKKVAFENDDPQLECWEMRLLTYVNTAWEQSGQQGMPNGYSWKRAFTNPHCAKGDGMFSKGSHARAVPPSGEGHPHARVRRSSALRGCPAQTQPSEQPWSH